MYHCGLVPIPIPKAMKAPAAEVAVDKEESKLKNLPAWSDVRR